ncbi:MAG: DUF4919 domain-containing protein [Bacteroidota bacterium]
MKTTVFALLLLVACTALKAQIKDPLYQKGKDHYDKKEFREALYYFSKYISRDSSQAEVYKWIGNCFFDLNQLDSARNSYEKALKLSPHMPELYYNLGNLYTQLQQPLKAENNIRTFVKLKPDDPDGLIQLASIFQNQENDSSLLLLEHAMQLDTLNPYTYNLLASEYFTRAQFRKALHLAEKSRRYFPYFNELVSLECYAHFALGEYDAVLGLVDTLIHKSAEPIPYYILKAKSEIMQQTPADKVSQHLFSFGLPGITSSATARLDRLVGEEGPYHYPTLLEKFRNNVHHMGLHEFFMVYYGFTTDSRYSPYRPDVNDLSKLMEDDNMEGVVKECKAILKQDEFNISVYQTLSLAEFRLKQYDNFEISLKRYLGLIESVLATGKGNSYDSAYIVISPRHEYDVLRYLGLGSNSQSLRHQDGHSFDVLKTQDETRAEDEIFFNIDKPFGSLEASLGPKKTERKKKKSKKD